jgi:hypothetical protein
MDVVNFILRLIVLIFKIFLKIADLCILPSIGKKRRNKKDI